MKRHILGLAAAIVAAPSMAQAPPPSEGAMLVSQASAQPAMVLPQNTEVLLSMNETITTKGKRWGEGDTFDLTVVHKVMMGGYIVIPRGARAVGRITWLTDKGAFGKSGKMEFDLEYVEVNGRRIPLSGHYRQEGEGNTVATIGTVVLVGVFAGFVTGKSGVIPQGRELMARTKEDLPLAFQGPPPIPASEAMPVSAMLPARASTSATPAIAAPSATRRLKRGVRCDTCR